MTIDRVRDLCRSAAEALSRDAREGNCRPLAVNSPNHAALTFAREAVQLAVGSLGHGSYPHLQALVVEGWILTETGCPDAALSVFRLVEELYPDLSQDFPEEVIHLIGQLALGYQAVGEGDAARGLLALLIGLTGRTYGEDHPRTVMLRFQGQTWLEQSAPRPLALWHF